jgi:predicted RND superfamily exporter protein
MFYAITGMKYCILIINFFNFIFVIIFFFQSMHCLNFCGKSNLDDRVSISENLSEKNSRMNDFNDFVKINKIMPNSINEKPLLKTINKIERQTRQWPLTYSESLVASISTVS